MITVYADHRGEKYRLLVEGHAGREGAGSLVCAAVSALTGALVEYAKSNPVCRYVRTASDKGRVFLSCQMGLENAFEMTVGALMQLAAAYPRHIMRHSAAGNTLFCSRGESVSQAYEIRGV